MADVGRELTEALGRVKTAVDSLRSQAGLALPLFREHAPGDAKAIESLLAELGKSEPEITRILSRLETKTDPTLWFLREEAP